MGIELGKDPVGTHKGQKTHQIHGAGLQAFVAHWTWVLGCNLYLGTSTINYQVISPASDIYF